MRANGANPDELRLFQAFSLTARLWFAFLGGLHPRLCCMRLSASVSNFGPIKFILNI